VSMTDLVVLVSFSVVILVIVIVMMTIVVLQCIGYSLSVVIVYSLL